MTGFVFCVSSWENFVTKICIFSLIWVFYLWGTVWMQKWSLAHKMHHFSSIMSLDHDNEKSVSQSICWNAKRKTAGKWRHGQESCLMSYMSCQLSYQAYHLLLTLFLTCPLNDTQFSTFSPPQFQNCPLGYLTLSPLLLSHICHWCVTSATLPPTSSPLSS